MSTLFGIPTDRINRSAEISDCGRYRWWLRRSWQLWDSNGLHVKGKGVCCFVMLNPSTADGTQDDPTIRRCIGFAKAWGYDTLSVRNLFPWRATDPRELFKAESVTGGIRGEQELMSAATADLLVVAWGAHVPFSRDTFALKLFGSKPIHCLGTTKHGHPRHPLYVKADTLPSLFSYTSQAFLDKRASVNTPDAPPAPTNQKVGK